jgi:DNA-binding beta-propeller fold protein YncE
MKANRGHKNLGRPFRFLLVLALLAVLGLGVTPPLGTAAPQESKMYVTNYGNDTISRANLDGTGGVSLGNLSGTLNGPAGIALDLAASEMCVTNYGYSSTISGANLDGTGGVGLGDLNGTLNWSPGIALDLAAGKMYVTNYGSNTISRANLDGSGGVSLGNLNDALTWPYGIALDLAAGEMYVANNGNSTIIRANLDGTGGVSLGGLNGTLNGPVGIALALVTPQPVGGYAVAVSRVKLLAPWLGLVAVALAVAGAALSWRRSA